MLTLSGLYLVRGAILGGALSLGVVINSLRAFKFSKGHPMLRHGPFDLNQVAIGSSYAQLLLAGLQDAVVELLTVQTVLRAAAAAAVAAPSRPSALGPRHRQSRL